MSASGHPTPSPPALPTRQRLAVQEAERARIARDLHDELGQLLTALRLSASALAQTLQDPASRTWPAMCWPWRRTRWNAFAGWPAGCIRRSWTASAWSPRCRRCARI